MADLKKVSLLLGIAKHLAPIAVAATKNPEHHAEAEALTNLLGDVATLVNDLSTQQPAQ